MSVDGPLVDVASPRTLSSASAVLLASALALASTLRFFAYGTAVLASLMLDFFFQNHTILHKQQKQTRAAGGWAARDHRKEDDRPHLARPWFRARAQSRHRAELTGFDPSTIAADEPLCGAVFENVQWTLTEDAMAALKPDAEIVFELVSRQPQTEQSVFRAGSSWLTATSGCATAPRCGGAERVFQQAGG